MDLEPAIPEVTLDEIQSLKELYGYFFFTLFILMSMIPDFLEYFV